MIIELRQHEDLLKIEEAMREMLGARRLDFSVLYSRNYIEFRQMLMKHVADNQPVQLLRATFSNETLMLRVIQTEPVLVWIGHKDAETSTEDPPI